MLRISGKKAENIPWKKESVLYLLRSLKKL
jgi:hypothetical protein